MNENTPVIVSTEQVMSSEGYPYTLSLRKVDIEDEKTLNHFIKSCEKLVRLSPEYKLWTNYVRDVLGYTTCSITGEKHCETTVEIHHHPISLYSYIKAIILKKSTDSEEFCSFDIATCIIEEHYNMKVPFCLLLKSMHQKFHNGFLRIPMEIIVGDIEYFMKKYMHYLEDDEVDTILKRTKVNKENCGWADGYKWSKDNYAK